MEGLFLNTHVPMDTQGSGIPLGRKAGWRYALARLVQRSRLRGLPMVYYRLALFCYASMSRGTEKRYP